MKLLITVLIIFLSPFIFAQESKKKFKTYELITIDWCKHVKVRIAMSSNDTDLQDAEKMFESHNCSEKLGITFGDLLEQENQFRKKLRRLNTYLDTNGGNGESVRKNIE